MGREVVHGEGGCFRDAPALGNRPEQFGARRYLLGKSTPLRVPHDPLVSIFAHSGKLSPCNERRLG